MLWTIIGVLAVLWLLGVVTSYTMGGLIHILLVIAVIVFLLDLSRILCKLKLDMSGYSLAI